MTASLPTPPLVGFNNNVAIAGTRFHIQTEDLGSHGHTSLPTSSLMVGTIKSVRTDYSEHVNRPDRPAVIQQMMRDQHRAMALDLRDGRLDAKIDGLTLSAVPPAAEEDVPESPGATPKARASMTVVATAPQPDIAVVKASRRKAAPSTRAPAGKKRRASQPPSSKGGRKGRPSASSVLQAKPNADSIFGSLPQESLDDVILGYVTQTKNGPPSRDPK